MCRGIIIIINMQRHFRIPEKTETEVVGNILGLAIFAATELRESIQLLHETMRIISEQQFRDTFKAERNVGIALKNQEAPDKPTGKAGTVWQERRALKCQKLRFNDQQLCCHRSCVCPWIPGRI